MATTGQTINDRMNSLRYALGGQGLARAVCKATTEEVLAPKKKHIDYLVVCTKEPHVSIPQLANILIERTHHLSWAVVFKALITIHNLMNYGSEKFSQYLATSNHSFDMPDFMDRTTQGYTMSSFVRRYAKYINVKCASYRSLAIDLCRIESSADNALRIMNMEKLSKTLPIVQSQFDSLLDFGAEEKDLDNYIIMAAFRLLYKDLIKLYIAYNQAIINLLERYFHLNRKKTRDALELYKNYLARMEKITSFLRIVDAVGLDTNDMPDTKSPAGILKLMEDHLDQLEAKKKNKGHGVADGSTTPEASCDTDQTKDETTSSPSGQDQPPEAMEDPSSSGVATKGEPPSIGPKQVAPPKPARPSPRSSPKVSPSKPAQPESAATAKKVPTPSTSQAARVIDKQPTASKSAVPPQRPSKPPSRPPQPAVASALSEQSAKISSTPPPPPLPPHPPAPHHTTSPPPPHPPPPTHKPTVATSSPSPSPQQPPTAPPTAQPNIAAASEPQDEKVELEDRGTSLSNNHLAPESSSDLEAQHETESGEAPSCSSIRISTTESQGLSDQVGDNHLDHAHKESDINHYESQIESESVDTAGQHPSNDEGGGSNNMNGSQSNQDNPVGETGESINQSEVEQTIPNEELEMPPPPPPIEEVEEQVEPRHVEHENGAEAPNGDPQNGIASSS